MRIDSRKLEKMSEWMEKREDIPKGWIYLGDDIECYFIGQPGKRNILVFLANPGTSNPGDNNIDSTMKKVKKLATEDKVQIATNYLNRISEEIPSELNVERLYMVVKKLNNAREIQHLIKDSVSLIEIRKICDK